MSYQMGTKVLETSEKRVFEGGVLSPILFNVYINISRCLQKLSAFFVHG